MAPAAIGVAKPYLADRIARHILEVERAAYVTPECRNVAISHAINPLIASSRYLPTSTLSQRFVSRQMDNRRPATRKKSEGFLNKWPLAEHAVPA